MFEAKCKQANRSFRSLFQPSAQEANRHFLLSLVSYIE